MTITTLEYIHELLKDSCREREDYLKEAYDVRNDLLDEIDNAEINNPGGVKKLKEKLAKYEEKIHEGIYLRAEKARQALEDFESQEF